MGKYHYIDEHSREILSRRAGQSDASHIERKAVAAYAMPVLAKATGDVAEGALGSFALYKNKPSGLELGSATRDAYALCAIASGDRVELQKFVGESSGGYWAARKCGSEGDTSGEAETSVEELAECVCRIEALLAREIELSGNLEETFSGSTTMEQEIGNVKLACKCSTIEGYESCTRVVGGQIPMPITVELGGVIVPDPGEPYSENQARFREWINGTHVFTEDDFEGCWGIKTLYEDPNNPSVTTRVGELVLLMGSLSGSAGWVLETGLRHIPIPNPRGSNVLYGGDLNETDMTKIASISGYTVEPHWSAGAGDVNAYNFIDARNATGTISPADAEPSLPPPPPPPVFMDPTAGYGSFDGVGDYVDIGGILSGTARTMSFLLRSTQGGTSKYLADFNSPRCVFAWRTPAGQVGYFDGVAWHSFGTPPDDGEWHEVTFTVDGTVAKAYVDGVQLGSDATVASQDLTGVTAGVIAAVYTAAGSWFQGDIARVCVYEAALSAAAVVSLGGGPPPEADMVALYDFNDGEGLQAGDGSGNGNDGTVNAVESGFWTPYLG